MKKGQLTGEHQAHSVSERHEPPAKGNVMAPIPGADRQLSEPDRWLGLVLAFISLCVVVTCSAGRPPEAPTQGPLLTQQLLEESSGPALPSSQPSPPRLPAAPNAPAFSASSAPHSQTPRFFAALKALKEQRRTQNVRIAWFGDSHTAADLWTQAVRRILQEEFGVGGPGFFHLGLERTRHSQIKIDIFGEWRRLPSQPSRTQPFLDGVFGIGGIRAQARHNAVCKAKAHTGTIEGRARWDIYYRVPDRASLHVRLGEHEQLLRGDGRSKKQIQTVSFETAVDAELVVRQVGGMPELFGASVEGSSPGVVIDTLGIDGARARTPLAWDIETWGQQLAARAPDLVVLAYGTNEVFERYAAERYVADYEELMLRLRAVLPSVECFMIGPTDVSERLDGHSHPRVLEVSRAQQKAASALGCMYLGAHELMGGEGSMAAWQTSKPQLGGADGIHLTVRGYQELGTLTAEYLLAQYRRATGE